VGARDIFDNFIQQHTHDHSMIVNTFILTRLTRYSPQVIDQTEAKYDIPSTFFVDKAPDPDKEPIEPFKIGDNQFWKESGCSWKKQLERYENTPAKNKREDWEKKADERWKADKEIPNPDDAKGDDTPLVMNNPRFAPKEYRDAITQLTLKKLGKSNVQRAHERLENLGKFIPGPTYKQRY